MTRPTSVQLMPAYDISQMMDLRGLSVLEIGGNGNGIAAQEFLDRGCSSAVVSGLDHITNDQSSDNKIDIVKANALDLSSKFSPSSFDVVFGCSFLEHISDLSLLLENIRYVLKKGGVAWLEGDPLWTSARGHHIWIDSKMRSASTKRLVETEYNYFFNNTSPRHGKPSFNPVPDWGHLIYSPDELHMLLVRQRHMTDYDASAICQYVYDDTSITRKSIYEFRDVFMGSSELKLVSFEHRSRRRVPDDVFEAVSQKNRLVSSGKWGLSVNGIIVLLVN